jgi:predicted nuclease of restriction endonuclease-like (RecB) superfamily
MDRPGKVNNRTLLKNQGFEANYFDMNFFELRDGLLEHYDFEAINEEVFQNLKLWYGVDFEIVRNLKKDPTQKNRLYIDLYPGNRIKFLIPV